MAEMIGPINGTQAGPKNVFSDFFGQVVSGVSTGLQRIGNEILPNWVESQLTMQEKDQLERNMFDPLGYPAPARLDTALTTQYATTTPGSPLTKNIGFLMDNFNLQITGLQLAVAAGAFLAGFWFFRRVI